MSLSRGTGQSGMMLRSLSCARRDNLAKYGAKAFPAVLVIAARVPPALRARYHKLV